MEQDRKNGVERIRSVFAALRRAHRKALIPFLMGGDPDLDTTQALVLTLAEAGADAIEVGVPFSDPLADGPIIQRAASRALRRGATPPALLEMLRKVSQRIPTPLMLLSYWNPILQYRNGRHTRLDPSAFIQDARAAGVCGVIVPDLPMEEAHAFRRAAHPGGVATVFLAAPTSGPHRLRQIAQASEGFIYYVSVTGTTGVRNRLAPEWFHGVRQLQLVTTKPICVGFGVSTPAQASSIARVADGVIIGSALIQTLEPVLHRKRHVLTRAARFIRRFRSAL